MDERIQAARKILETEYQYPLTVTGTAKRVGLSRPHLEFLFKRETGLTLKACLREVRLKEAAKLLDADHLSVKQVAFSVGYRDTSNFDRDFKRHFGKRPSDYYWECAQAMTTGSGL